MGHRGSSACLVGESGGPSEETPPGWRCDGEGEGRGGIRGLLSPAVLELPLVVRTEVMHLAGNLRDEGSGAPRRTHDVTG